MPSTEAGLCGGGGDLDVARLCGAQAGVAGEALAEVAHSRSIRRRKLTFRARVITEYWIRSTCQQRTRAFFDN